MIRFFVKNNQSKLKLIVIIFIAFTMIFFDITFGFTKKFRSSIDTIFDPWYLFINNIEKTYNRFLQITKEHKKILLENNKLRQKLFIQDSEQQLINFYKKENNDLRLLLNLPINKNQKKLIAQVICFIFDFYQSQILIDKGSSSGVYVGQSVINNEGIVGQVISSTKYISRVLLIFDKSHALPTKILRNGIHVITVGNGLNNSLKLKNILENVDIRVGDILVTSGIGGCFPIGYPVGVISSINKNMKKNFTEIKVRSAVQIQHLNYLLLIWDNNHKNDEFLCRKIKSYEENQ